MKGFRVCREPFCDCRSNDLTPGLCDGLVDSIDCSSAFRQAPSNPERRDRRLTHSLTSLYVGAGSEYEPPLHKPALFQPLGGNRRGLAPRRV